MTARQTDDDEVARVLADLKQGAPRALSRAISWVENGDRRAAALLERVYAEAPHPWVIGITGVGGGGKSSLMPHLATHLTGSGRRVAVLAVDPSSPLSGGALLGDRIRDLNEDRDKVFFRSVASRGGQGGLATCVADLVRVFAAAGCDTVLIETVGAGQSEVAVLDVAHSVVLVTAPGLGDEVQALKAGVMEIADLVVVNKADRPGADETVQTLRHVIALAAHDPHVAEGLSQRADGGAHWHVPVLTTIALTGAGVDTLAAALSDHRQALLAMDRYVQMNKAHDLRRMRQYFAQLIAERAEAAAESSGIWSRIEHELARDARDPLSAARNAAAEIWSGAGRERS